MPLQPYLQPQLPYVLFYHFLKSIQKLLFLLELQLLRNILLLVVGVERQLAQVQAVRGRKQNVNLVFIEGVGNVAWIVAVHEELYDASNHLPDLMIDETLSRNDEPSQIIHFFALEFHHVPSGLWVPGVESF